MKFSTKWKNIEKFADRKQDREEASIANEQLGEFPFLTNIRNSQQFRYDRMSTALYFDDN